MKRCPNVTISTRSGSWIIPNYISGFATDLYACRTFLNLPWKVGSWIMEIVIKFIYGNPKLYNLYVQYLFLIFLFPLNKRQKK
jgi:dimethylaniline monooxygenase (N-oxide forming)